ncbi:NAD-dependent epimerase/dehydratase family protein [Legionella parisiensis]|uniref:3 beta-hydroxysteroid dehydrogenase/Delta 5-->4-isomerase n=1 Tax=Legionella parisiensis TaxID=45071 RepID=A0A1E5JKS2_9GAMM|nr:NAD-dependent epimerase/dehydratase family protein [Legionella parisiensis]KTD43068.1 3-beta-hydroxysteroid dehydrogenase/isomerase [Legionella parisiensis]OEH45147.1 3 beta-hydroxysteroid dehydrogenase/Delta 5-->4-isomerase [Legionella parisiensis]STX77853.1 3-beta-hydroxysteroid dehydrogenase/isomerase [Legionella parisiensis]
MKILVTGASGHIGNNLISELIKKQYDVRILVRSELPKYLAHFPLDVCEGDILHPESLYEATRDIDTVFHLAAKIAITNREAEEVRKTNIQGTQNVVNACLRNQVKKLVHFSSIHTLIQNSQKSNAAHILNENSPLVLESVNIYDQSKAHAEKIVLDSCEQGLNAVVVNPTGVIGPNDYKLSLMGTAIIKIYKGHNPVLVRGGFNFVDVRDVVQGALTAAEKGKSGERYILGGHDINMHYLVRLMSTVRQKRMTRLFLPPNMLYFVVPLMQFFSKITNTEPLFTKYAIETLMYPPTIDCTKAENELGYKKTKIETTIHDTLDWFSQSGKIKL